MLKTIFFMYVVLKSLAVLASTKPQFSLLAVRSVNSTANDATQVGTLPYWLLNANDGDTIDCSLIHDQAITLTSSLPALTKSFVINGAGITIDGANTYQAFQIASGTSAINNLTVQNSLSKGGNGGDGYAAGGGAVGGGGALYIHGGSAVTIDAVSLINNTAQGGNGGSASYIGNAGGGGGGGFGGGDGGGSLTIVSAGGGGGGHSNGGDGGGSSDKNGSTGNYFGGAGGGAGINVVVSGGTGGNAGPTGAFIGGIDLSSSGNGGGGAGNSQNGQNATGSSAAGTPGGGGLGIGTDLLFGAGGGGGAASETNNVAAGAGAGGGGGGSNDFGGNGGILGGGGGGGLGQAGSAGDGGFGAGGGGGYHGGLGGGGFKAGGGKGGSTVNGDGVGAGGGGSGLGGAIFIQKGASLTILDASQIFGNTAIAGVGGSSTSDVDPGYVPAENGLALGQDIFMRQGSSLTFNLNNQLIISTPIEGDYQTSPVDSSGSLIKTGSGTLELNGTNTYVGLTTIEEGSLNLNGSIEQDIQINASAQFSGNAIVNGSISNDGSIAPGNDIGTIYTKDVTFTKASSYTVEIYSPDSDLIDVSGFASLGGVVKVIQNPGTYPSQGQYTILKAKSGISGSFNSVEALAQPGYQFSLDQDQNNVYLKFSLLLSPTNVSAKQLKKYNCRFVNILKWDAPVSGGIASYQIYRDNLNNLIGEIAADGSLELRDENPSKISASTYYIVSVDSRQTKSSPAEITLAPKKCSTGGGGTIATITLPLPLPEIVVPPVAGQEEFIVETKSKTESNNEDQSCSNQNGVQANLLLALLLARFIKKRTRAI